MRGVLFLLLFRSLRVWQKFFGFLRASFSRMLPPYLTLCSYRSMAANTKVARLRAERKYVWLKQLFSYVRGFIRTPNVNLPLLTVPDDTLAIDDRFIESAASITRKEWGLGTGPISDIMLLMENNGIVISKVFVDSAYMDGYSSIDSYSGQAFIVLASDKGVAVRSRFDLGP